MSRNTDAASITVAGRPLTVDEQDERSKYSAIPNIPGVDGAVAFIATDLRIEVTPHYLRRAITQRRLARHEIGHKIHFSARDLYDFIVLGTRKTEERISADAKASA
ncbi:hypothetical protein [Mycobacterium sp. Z3061]|uniref:hypothetical protein n=1 Tax=Mycobacterium sp. Z3061 TaxID=3073562 RepID=UPI0028737485|nr:hypothetical protein [Mycobacterium sp. Z3061]